MSQSVTSTADLFTDVIRPSEPSFDASFAQMVLRMRLSEEATDRLRLLLQQNNAGTISPEDKAALDQMLMTGQFIDLLQAKARLSLQQSAAAQG